MQDFVINSPDFEAAKFWVGNLGKTATHTIVYAQLITPDGVCQGLHSFVVQVALRLLVCFVLLTNSQYIPAVIGLTCGMKKVTGVHRKEGEGQTWH